jgi:hypothetical protein
LHVAFGYHDTIGGQSFANAGSVGRGSGCGCAACTLSTFGPHAVSIDIASLGARRGQFRIMFRVLHLGGHPPFRFAVRDSLAREGRGFRLRRLVGGRLLCHRLGASIGQPGEVPRDQHQQRHRDLPFQAPYKRKQRRPHPSHQRERAQRQSPHHGATCGVRGRNVPPRR